MALWQVYTRNETIFQCDWTEHAQWYLDKLAFVWLTTLEAMHEENEKLYMNDRNL